jgi:hypothetical protein
VFLSADVIQLMRLDIEGLRHLAILATVAGAIPDKLPAGSRHPSSLVRISRLQGKSCLGLNEVDQTAHAQVSLELFSLGVRDGSFAVSVGELTDSSNGSGSEFPLQDGLGYFGTQIPAIGSDDIGEDVGFSRIRGVGHVEILSQKHSLLERPKLGFASPVVRCLQQNPVPG